MRPAAPTLQGVDKQFDALFRDQVLPAIAPPVDPHASEPKALAVAEPAGEAA